MRQMSNMDPAARRAAERAATDTEQFRNRVTTLLFRIAVGVAGINLLLLWERLS